MPFIGLYTWTEKDDVIKIVIPLKGASPNKVDIYVTSSTLKVNFSPYIVEIILQFPIDPIKHKANIKNGNLRVTLFKTEESVGFWGSLEVDTEDKSAIMKLREDSILAQDALERELGESRRDRRTDDERFSLRKQMGLDEAERNRLDNLKLEEKKTAEEEVYATFSLMQAEKQRGSQKVVRAELSQPKLDPVYTSEPIDFETYSREKKTEVSSDIFDLSEVSVIDMTKGDFEDEDTDYSGAVGIPTSRSSSSINPVKYALVHVIEDEVNDVRYIPPPRLTSTAADGKGKVDVHFTPRVFPTPMRESKIAEEDDWIAKNRRHLKKHGVLGSSATRGNGVDASEEDPAWLKAKGDDFYRGGDLRSALNAYSAALDMDENMVSCYSNRSACYLRLNMVAECRLDCSEGIKLIDEELSANNTATALPDTLVKEMITMKVMLSKLLLRRGSANCQMGIFSEALQDYTRTTNLLFGYNDKSDGSTNKVDKYEDSEFSISGITKPSLAADVDRICRLLDADILKKEGDALFADNKLTESCLKYEKAICLVPVHVGCLSNRSACKLAMKDVHGCIDDCSKALALLSDCDSKDMGRDTISSSSPDINMLTAILPSAGTEKRVSWTVKTLLRRGAAYAQLNSLDDAVADYRAASALDQKNEILKSDLNKIINFREGKRMASG